MKPEFNKLLKDYSKKASIKGFRPGKVPAGLIKKMYGRQIKLEVFNKTITQSLQNYMAENKLPVLFQPVLASDPVSEEELIEQNNFDLEFEVLLEPEFELNVQHLDNVNKYVLEVSAEDVQENIENLRKSYPQIVKTEEVVEGDFIKGNFKSVESDFEKETVLPLNRVAEEQRQNFIGLKKGDLYKFDLRTAFPEADTVRILFELEQEAAEEMSGEFEMEITEIDHEELHELNKEFFAKVLGEEKAEGIETEEDFRKEIARQTQETNGDSAEYLTDREVRQALIEQTVIEFPEEMLKKLIQMNSEEKISEERLQNELPNFKKSLKWMLISSKVFKENELEISEEDVKEQARQHLQQQFASWGLGVHQFPAEQMEMFVNNFLSEGEGKNRNDMEAAVKDSMVYKLVKEQNTFPEKKVSMTELEKIFADLRAEAEAANPNLEAAEAPADESQPESGEEKTTEASAGTENKE